MHDGHEDELTLNHSTVIHKCVRVKPGNVCLAFMMTMVYRVMLKGLNPLPGDGGGGGMNDEC